MGNDAPATVDDRVAAAIGVGATTPAEVAARAGLSAAEVEAALARLVAGRVVYPNDAGGYVLR